MTTRNMTIAAGTALVAGLVLLPAVGGGALLDVAGLAAATAHRGVRHIRVPSTTLSQPATNR